MKTKMEIEQEIIKLTSKIQQEIPELTKFIPEMRDNNSEREEVNLENLENYYNSLNEMVNKYVNAQKTEGTLTKEEATTFPAYPLYTPSEDIYSQGKKEMDLNPEDISKKKVDNANQDSTWNEKDFNSDKSGADLDVPGSELDDKQEKIGNEDEENNYYSLGGDNHNNLEEN
jgi:hypothetical protein